MREKAPTEAPITTLTFIVGKEQVSVQVQINNPAWLAWFAQGLDQYRQTNRYIDPAYRDYGKFPPANPYESLVAFADGLSWNPGDGPGKYVYIDGQWRLIVPDYNLELNTTADYSSDIRVLKQEVSTLRNELAMIPDYKRQIAVLKQDIEKLKLEFNMGADYSRQIQKMHNDISDIRTEITMIM